MMKLKNIWTLAAGFLLLAATSCQNEDLANSKGTGLLNVNIQQENSLSTRAEVTPTQTMSLEILDAQGITVAEYPDAKTFTEPIALSEGTYTLHAYSAGVNAQEVKLGDASAYYDGRTEVMIQKDTRKEAKVVCRLAVAKVSVHYSESVLAAFPQLNCTVTGETGHVVFGRNETQSAYFPASGNLTASLALQNKAGQANKLDRVIEAIKPCTHYHLNYTLNDKGHGQFDVVFDPTTNTYLYDIKLPLESPFDVMLDNPDEYGQVAYLYATPQKPQTAELKFQYRLKDTKDWIDAVATLQEDGSYKGKTNQLEFATDYEYRMAVGTEPYSAVGSFTTESFVEIPNLDFNTWSQNGKNHFMNADAADSFWATGNTGCTVLGSANTVPVEGGEAHSGKAARMETVKMALVGTAAGNLFIGTYKTNMGNPAASVGFGRPYNGARPLAMKGFYRYNGVAINNGGTIPSDPSFTNDEGDIYLKVWDAKDNVIGEGHFYPKGTVNSYQEFNIPIVYTSKAKAAKITIVCTSSRYGGEFSGKKVVGKAGKGSVLWVDDFSLSYGN